MKAAVLTGLGRLEIRDVPSPAVEKGDDVLLRIEAVGVCGSDVHYFARGGIGGAVVEYPWIVGHECAGTVVEVGCDVVSLAPGARVAVDPLIACGECDQCRAGRPHTCRSQAFLGCPAQAQGALCEYLVIPRRCCRLLGESMTADQAVMVEPLSVGLWAHRLSAMPADATVGILGTGPIGLCVLLTCRASGSGESCKTYVTDLIDDRLRVARECGADWAGNAAAEDVVREIASYEPGGLDVVFECAGCQETLDQAVELLTPGGTLVIVGIPPTERVGFSADLMRRKELRVQNVRRQNECVARAIELIADGEVDVDRLVTHHFPLDAAATAFEMVAEYRDGVVKAVIDVVHGLH